MKRKPRIWLSNGKWHCGLRFTVGSGRTPLAAFHSYMYARGE